MREPAVSRQRRFADFRLAVFNDVARLGFVRHLELVARFGDPLQAEHFHGRRGAGFFHRAALVVEHGANLAVHGAANKDVAGVQRAVLHQHGRHRAPALVHARFEHCARGRRLRIGAQLAHFGHEEDHLQQLSEILFLLGGNFHHHRVPAPFLRRQAALGELALHALHLRFGFVDLVDGHDDRNARSLGVINRLLRLRHDAVVGRDHEHDNIGDLRAPRAHPGERFVARSIHEHDAAAVHRNLRRTDVLRDSAGLARRDFGLANRVQQARLAVVHVPHHGHNRRTRLVVFGLVLPRDVLDHFLLEGDDLDDSVEGFGESRRRGDIKRLIDAGEDAAVEQYLQNVLGANVEFLGQIAHRDALGDR